MTASRLILPAISTLACLMAGQLAFAHGDPEVPLYVAEDGLDSGRCDNEMAPCRTIGFALSRATKGTEIRVAEGSYEISDAEDAQGRTRGGHRQE